MSKKKILENPVLASMVVPVAIILVGTLIIVGVTKMLSVGQNHRQLVQELGSKTFGNRWVAAYELSKLVAAKKIPQEDIPWVIERLSNVYKTSAEARTRNFIVLALSSLDNRLTHSLLETAVSDPDPNVKFSAIVAIGNQTGLVAIDWKPIFEQLKSDDAGVRQAVVYTIAAKRAPAAQVILAPALKDEDSSVRLAAATALIQYRSMEATSLIKQSLLEKTHESFDAVKWQSIKLNMMNAIAREKWSVFNAELEQIASTDSDLKLSTKAKEVLNLLKN